MVTQRTTSPIPLEMFQHSKTKFQIPVYDDDDAAVDVSALTMRFTVHDSNNQTVGVFDVEDGSIGHSGDANEIAEPEVSASDSATARDDLHWELWDITGGAATVLAHGSLTIKPAVANVA